MLPTVHGETEASRLRMILRLFHQRALRSNVKLQNGEGALSICWVYKAQGRWKSIRQEPSTWGTSAQFDCCFGDCLYRYRDIEPP
jgi:hypothetical protein